MRLLVSTLIIMACGCSFNGSVAQPLTADSLPASSDETFQTVSPQPDTQFIFEAPDGFLWNEKHRLWYDEAHRTSVVAAHTPGATFQFVVEDFVEERMRPAGMQLRNKEIREIKGRPTLLLHSNRLASRYPQQLCTVAFPTKTGCAQITAIYPAELDEAYKQTIEKALLNSRCDSD